MKNDYMLIYTQWRLQYSQQYNTLTGTIFSLPLIRSFSPCFFLLPQRAPFLLVTLLKRHFLLEYLFLPLATAVSKYLWKVRSMLDKSGNVKRKNPTNYYRAKGINLWWLQWKNRRINDLQCSYFLTKVWNASKRESNTNIVTKRTSGDR